jgi:hypothetical protein
MDFNEYSFDKDLAEKGRKIPLDDDGAYMTICRWGNKKMMSMREELMKPYSNTNIGRLQYKMDDDEQQQIMFKIVAATILVDWGGMKDDGAPIDYSVETAIKMFKKHERFLLDIIELSQDDATFKHDTMEEELGNSGTDSEANSESEASAEH